jgi:hypothetical protein
MVNPPRGALALGTNRRVPGFFERPTLLERSTLSAEKLVDRHPASCLTVVLVFCKFLY